MSLGSAKLGSVALSARGGAPLTLRNAIEKRLEGHAIKKGKGILLTIDEAQAAARDELVAIATALQHVITDEDQKNLPDVEKKGVAFVFAGLPSMVDELVNDKVLTFMRRSMRRDLAAVADLAERRGKSRAWVNKYRAVLINEQVARPAGYGRLAFAIPHLGAYIRGQGACPLDE